MVTGRLVHDRVVGPAPLVCLAVSDHSAGGSVSGVPGSRVAGRQHLRTYG